MQNEKKMCHFGNIGLKLLSKLAKKSSTVTQFCIFQYLQSPKSYRQVSNISRTKSQQLKDFRSVLRLSLPNPLKPDVK